MTWLTVLLAVAAVVRFTVLVNRDMILEPARRWTMAKALRAEDRADTWKLANGWERLAHTGTIVYRGDGDPPSLPGMYRSKWRGGFWPWLDNLIGCPWCVSVYVSIPVALVAVWFPTNRLVIAGLLACTASLASGLVIEAWKHRYDE
jgi:hypothetical protein